MTGPETGLRVCDNHRGDEAARDCWRTVLVAAVRTLMEVEPGEVPLSLLLLR